MTASHGPESPTELPGKFRAPQCDRQCLVVPSVPYALRVALQNQDARNCLPFGSWTLARLRKDARADALRAAIEHTSSYRDLWIDQSQIRSTALTASWLVAGHQPELFHSGVWFKNFLLSQTGQRTGALALNLVIDNDLCRSPSIRVPARGADGILRMESLLFDAPTTSVAWECRPIADLSVFDSFSDRVLQNSVKEIDQPLVVPLWNHARNAARRTGRLGLALAEARHVLEGELGLQTLELPLSRLCGQPGFARFSLELLRQLPRFQQIYNQERSDYREANGIRSETHPVPALGQRHGWYEAPWWVYRMVMPERRRLFAKLDQGNLILSDQAGWQEIIEGPLDGEDAVAQWQELALDGVLLRPRALITTMFVRLVISDLFMHGIGGGKYDQMTDAIIARFFDVPPPAMCVATATMFLPQLAQPVTEGRAESLFDNQAAIERELELQRRLRFQPEEHLQAPNSEAQQLLAAKREHLQRIPPRGEKRQWHRSITRINQRLAELNQFALAESEQRVHALVAQARQLKLAHSREFSFCLFEQGYLAGALASLAVQQFDPPSAK